MSARTDILDGKFAASVAGTAALRREALKLMLRQDLKLTDVVNADINGYFLTKPDLKCFDAAVQGNVGNHGKGAFNLSCHFSTHYFLQTGTRYYDPCLMAVYGSAEGPVWHRTRLVSGAGPGLRKAGTGSALIILHLLPGRSVPGFGSVWEILLPSECKAALSALDFRALKDDLEVKAAKLL